MNEVTERKPRCPDGECSGNIIVRTYTAKDTENDVNHGFFGVFAFCDTCGRMLDHQLRERNETKLKIADK